MEKTINLYGKKNYLKVYKYAVNNNLCLEVEDKNGNVVQGLSINLIDNIKYDQIFLCEFLSKETIDKLVKLDIISKPIKKKQYNMGTYDLVNVNFDELKKYDEKGVEEYLKDHIKTKNKKKNGKYYTKDELKEIINDKERLVYVECENDELIVKYKDIPDVIVSLNDKLGFVDLKVYDYDNSDFSYPLLTTKGYFLDYCDSEVRKDIIDRLENLMLGGAKVKKYKIVDEDMYDELKIDNEKER